MELRVHAHVLPDLRASQTAGKKKKASGAHIHPHYGGKVMDADTDLPAACLRKDDFRQQSGTDGGLHCAS